MYQGTHQVQGGQVALQRGSLAIKAKRHLVLATGGQERNAQRIYLPESWQGVAVFLNSLHIARPNHARRMAQDGAGHLRLLPRLRFGDTGGIVWWPTFGRTR